MARCGMRISEPLRLFRNHYRSDDGTIYIEKSKFRKDRLIPAPKAAMMEIENYLAVRKSLSPDDKNQPISRWWCHLYPGSHASQH